MKVNLIKEAYYELNETKCSKLPYEVLCNMFGAKAVESDIEKEDKPSVRLFTSTEFMLCVQKGEDGNLDKTKDVYVLPNGQFCVFLKEERDFKSEESEHESTDTEENTANEA